MVFGWFGYQVGGLGGKCVVWGSIRLAWMILGWFVMVSGFGWYWVRLAGLKNASSMVRKGVYSKFTMNHLLLID